MSGPADKAARSKTGRFTMAGLRGPERHLPTSMPAQQTTPLPDSRPVSAAAG